jgi:flavin prenyltransferase
MKLPVIISMTGASGQIYAIRLVHVLAELQQPMHLVMSDASRLVIREEMKLDIPMQGDPVEFLWGKSMVSKVQYHESSELGANIASGSYRTSGMVICPCSTGTLGSVANGISRNLIERAAEVVLKERRKLIMVVRETPFSTIQLHNMHQLSQAGAVILPASPGFYHQPSTVDEMVDFVVARIIDQLGLEHFISKRWKNE